jgi:hypothetical protein
MSLTTKQISTTCAFALLLAGNRAFAEIHLTEFDDHVEESHEDVTRKAGCKKNKVYGNVAVCSNLSTDNFYVTGNATIANATIDNGTITNITIDNGTITNATIDNLTVVDDLTVDGTTLVNTLSVTGDTTLVGLLSLTSPNVLDYGFFYTTQSGVAPESAIFQTGQNASFFSYVASGLGCQIAHVGYYFVDYSATFSGTSAEAVTLGLALNGTVIPGTLTGFVATGTFSLSASAVIEVTSNISTLALVSPSLLVSVAPGASSATLSIVRVR